MKTRLHKCAAAHCQAQVPRHLLMCIEHWRMVPAPLRREVVAAWKAFQRAADPSDRHDAWLEHAATKAKAVTAVADKLQQRQADLAGKFGDLFDAADSHDKNETHGNTNKPSRRPEE